MVDDEIAVALAVVRNSAGQILIGRRDRGAHLGGMLEFPGGKTEAGETPAVAMVRELREETGLMAQEYRLLMSFPYCYSGAESRRLRFHVFLVTQSKSEDVQLLGRWRWSDSQVLDSTQFPAANAGILNALKLPAELMITADLHGSVEDVLAVCKRAIDSGVRLICLRDPQLSLADFQQVAADLLPQLRALGCQVMVNSAADLPVVALADGLHFTSKRLMAATERPVADDRWCSAACHDAEQLQQAVRLGFDFVTLSPLQMTATHSDAVPIGWQRFAELASSVPVPVYALGGMRRDDLSKVWQSEGQGVAGIRLFDSLNDGSPESI